MQNRSGNRYNIIMLFKYAVENNICYQFLSAYYVLFVMLETWNKLSHLVLTNVIQNNPKFRDNCARLEWLCDTAKDMQLLNRGAWVISQLCSLQALCLFLCVFSNLSKLFYITFLYSLSSKLLTFKFNIETDTFYNKEYNDH